MVLGTVWVLLEFYRTRTCRGFIMTQVTLNSSLPIVDADHVLTATTPD